MPAADGGAAFRFFRALISAWVLPFALSACTPGALRPNAAAAIDLPSPATTFDIAGRLSARHGAEAFSANFRWHHTGERDELEFASPLGQAVAMLSGDAQGVRLEAADGRVLTAASWVALTEKGLGWPLPVDGLASWIQGAPRAGVPFSAEAGEENRAALLRQDGWTIVYIAYAPDENAVQRPSRMTLSYPEVELRLAVDEWR
jgi:outer membrane lipoprotein LolB